MKDTSRLCWHGEPVKTEFGSAFINEDTEKPLVWYNYEVLNSKIRTSVIPAIRITTKAGNSFVISNHFGIGWLKLKHGGWPGTTHFSLPKDSFQPEEIAELKTFARLGIEYAQKFVTKVESGRARSTETYNDMKHLLTFKP